MLEEKIHLNINYRALLLRQIFPITPPNEKAHEVKIGELIPGTGAVQYFFRLAGNFYREIYRESKNEEDSSMELIIRALPHIGILGIYNGFMFAKLNKIYLALEQLL